MMRKLTPACAPLLLTLSDASFERGSRSTDNSILGNDTQLRQLSAKAYTGRSYDTRQLPALLDRLTAAMDARVPPPTERGGKDIVVRFDLALNKLVHYIESEGVAQFSVWYRLAWNDDRLRYNGTDVFGAGWNWENHYILISPESLWKPDCIPYYSNDVEDAATYRPSKCFVYDMRYISKTGYNVFWTQPALLNIHCKGALKMFPFDRQMCTIVVGPWDSNTATYRFRTLVDGDETLADWRGKLNSEEWEVTLVGLANHTKQYMVGTYEEVHYSIALRRFSHYYVVNIVLPMEIMVIASSFSCWLPLSGGAERLGYSATLLLTVMATTLFTAERRPATKHDTWLDQFQAWSIFLAFLPVVQSCLLVWLQHLIDSVKAHPGEEVSGSDAHPKSQSLSRRNSLQLLLHEDPLKAHDLLKITRTCSKSGWGSMVVVKAMHQWNAYPRTIDRFCRHVFSVIIAAVGAHMLMKIPRGQGFLVHADEAASERQLLALCGCSLGLLTVGAIGAAFLALFRFIAPLCFTPPEQTVSFPRGVGVDLAKSGVDAGVESWDPFPCGDAAIMPLREVASADGKELIRKEESMSILET